MASTGIRRFEATSLRLNDFSRDGLVIWNSKFNNSRLVPLHSSVNMEMKKYLRYRLRENTEDKHFFILSTGMALSANALSHTFRLLCKKIEPWNGSNRRVPTLNSLRHRFIIRSLEMVIKTDRKSVGRHMAALRAYVGHDKISHTYWYLRGTPELFQRISDASEAAFDRRTKQ